MADASTSPQGPAGLLTIPSEMRNEIYMKVFVPEDGFHIDDTGKKLFTAAGHPPDLSLSSACKKIYEETKNFTLYHSVVNFHPIPVEAPAPEEGLASASVQQITVDFWLQCMDRIMELSRDLITRPMIEEIATDYPDHRGIKQLLETEDDTQMAQLVKWCKGIPSFAGTYDPVQVALLQKLCQVEGFQDAVNREKDEPTNGRDTPALFNCDRVIELIKLKFEPWDAPNLKFFKVIEELLPMTTARIWDNWVNHMPLFSATAGAIYFLKSIGPEQYSKLRRIVIREERFAQWQQSCHFQGLIPFCKENVDLTIEARVDLIQTVLKYVDVIRPNNHSRASLFLPFMRRWFRDVLFLEELGMPMERFSLVFTSESPELTELISDMVRDIASKMDGARMGYREDRKEGDPPELDMFTPYIKEAATTLITPHALFIEDVKRTFEGNTCIRFDTSLAKVWDVNEAIRTYKQNPSEFPKDAESLVELRHIERIAKFQNDSQE